MAKRDSELFESLRARGVRKKIADQVSRAANGAAKPKVAKRAVADLSSAAAEIHDRLHGGPKRRSDAARKAARTRKRKAQQRSEAAKRGARARSRA